MSISQAKKLELITKHAKKFTTKGGSTPVLEGIHYAADGSAVTTDRHKLLRIDGAHSFSEPFTSHAKTGAPIDDKYPDTSRIIPTDFKTEIIVKDIAELTARVKLAVEATKVAGDKTYLATLKVSGADVTLSVNSEIPSIKFTAGISGEISGHDCEIAFNAEYMLAAMNVFKDAGSERVVIGLNGAMSPITLRDSVNGIIALVLPYRRPL